MKPTRGLLHWVALLMLLFAGAESAKGQCGPGWLPGDGLEGVNGTVYAMTMWDPDGPGPQRPRLVVGGEFSVAGAAAAQQLAVYDLETRRFSALGWPATSSGTIYALAALPNGDLIAGGTFSFSVGGVWFRDLVRWNGAAWTSLGSGLHVSGVRCMAVRSSGDLVVGGGVTGVGAVYSPGIAVWNGAVWSSLGSGIDTGVQALAVLPGGDIVAAGSFNAAGGVQVNNVARWDGTRWRALGTGVDGIVNTVLAMPNGDVVLGGYFTRAGGQPVGYISRWDGSSWRPLGSGLNAPVHALAMLPNGDVAAGGAFSNAGSGRADAVAHWNGSNWFPAGGGLSDEIYPRVYSLFVLPDGNLVAAGQFSEAGGVPVNGIARWDRLGWSGLVGGMASSIQATALSPTGEIYAAGSFAATDGDPATSIAVWNGTRWRPINSGPRGGLSPWIYALRVLPNGDLIVGGRFTTAGEVEAASIARWDGSRWSALGAGIPNGIVHSIAVASSGDLIVGGSFSSSWGAPGNFVARWNGQSWLPLGPGLSYEALAVAAMPNGDVIAAGQFNTAGGVPANRIARWDGATWSPLGSGIDGTVRVLSVLPNGDLVAVGDFGIAGGVPTNGIARWDGAAWSAMASGSGGQVLSATPYGANGLIVGGRFSTIGTTTATNVARWNGSQWLPLGGGPSDPSNAAVMGVIAHPNREVALGGMFLKVDSSVSAHFARDSFTGAPTMSVEAPEAVAPRTVGAGETLTLSATPANGYSGVSVRWLRDGVPLANGPGGASAGGGTVVGASGALQSPTRVSTAYLTISGVRPSDAGAYSAEFFNACGSVSSTPVRVYVIGSPCSPADIAASDGTPGPDGGVNNGDFQCFFASFFNSACAACGSVTTTPCNPADIARSDGTPGPDGCVDNGDFQLFFSSFLAGCP